MEVSHVQHKILICWEGDQADGTLPSPTLKLLGHLVPIVLLGQVHLQLPLGREDLSTELALSVPVCLFRLSWRCWNFGHS